MSRLSDEDITSGLAETRWERDGDAIVQEFEVPNFTAAIALVNRVAELAEAANHYPDILVHSSNQVRLTLSTQSEGGVTQADLDLAGRIDLLT
jgi:4a-hydroxytetrahydrobiopterin dehydratase